MNRKMKLRCFTKDTLETKSIFQGSLALQMRNSNNSLSCERRKQKYLVHQKSVKAGLESHLQSQCTAYNELYTQENPTSPPTARASSWSFQEHATKMTLVQRWVAFNIEYIQQRVTPELQSLRHVNPALHELEITLVHFLRDKQNALGKIHFLYQ